MNLQELMNGTGKSDTNNIGGGFNVLDTIDVENQTAKANSRNKLAKYLQDRSNLRTALKSGEKSTGNKKVDDRTVKTSELADTFTDAMVFLGKDPDYMMETYGNGKGNLDLINKVKQLQGGKYAGDIQNYLDGNADDLTGLVSNIFPTYVSGGQFEVDRATPKQTTKPTEINIPEGTKVLQGDTRNNAESVWDKIQNFRWSDIGLASEGRPIKTAANLVGGAVDNAQKIIPGLMDMFSSLTETSPEKFNQALDEGYYIQNNGVKKNAREQYDMEVKNRGYKGSYDQWINDVKDRYGDYYNGVTNTRQSIDDNRSDFWFNTMDKDMTSFQAGELLSDIGQQALLDKWLTSALGKGYDLYKGSKLIDNAKKGTELATRTTEMSAPGTQLANPALATIKNADGSVNPEVVKESKDIATKIMDWLSSSPTVKGGKDAMEFQLIGDVQDGKLSDAQAYGINAGLGAFLGKMLGLGRSTGKYIADPKEKLQTSLSRLGVEDTDEIINLAEIGAKDGTKPSALQATTESAIKEAKENATKIRDRVWEEELGPIRKSLPNDVNADIEKDLLDPLNESITNKGIGGKIVYKDGVASVEGNAGEYTEALKAIADKINSIKSNLEQKLELQAQGKTVDIPSSTRIYEEIYSDLKRVSMNEKDNAVKKNILDIQEDMLNVIKKQLTPEQYENYKKALENYSKAATRVSKIDQAESMMMNRNVVDQGKFKDGQYLSDFLTELEKDGIISKNAADRRIASIFADAFYGGPVKDTDKLIYPSLPGFMEKILQTTWDIAKNPKGTKLFGQEIGGGWRKFNTNYKPAAGTKIVSGIGNRGSAVGIGKATTSAADNGED